MAKMSELNRWTGQPYSERYYEILEKRKDLPVWHHKQEFLEAFSHKQCLIVVGETGSGKSTQIPQFVLDVVNRDNPRNRRIACTEPRKLAALSLARRVAEEMDVTIGEEVGFRFRFEDCTSNRTVLNFLTDGKLVREAMIDPLLKAYKVIILDEAHERTMSTDILFAHLKKLLMDRDDLKLVVMSATLQAEKFNTYFGGSQIIKVPGKLYPVDILYSKEPRVDYLEAAVSTVLVILQNTTKGDILVFLTGQEEIEQACHKIKREVAVLGNKISPVKLVPLYSSLPPDLQQEAFEPARLTEEGIPAERKVVMSTNIAETSLTIDGIVYVVDTGLSKQKFYNPEVRCDSLLVAPISKASAHQRSGRAGRTQWGRCYRLYTENSFNVDLQEETIPEIQRSKLDSIVLTLMRLGVDNLVHFDYMDPPAPQTLLRAIEVLVALKALDGDGKLTELGKRMTEFPVEPQMAKMLLVSPRYNCSNEILSIAAMLSVPNCFVRSTDKDLEDKRAIFKHKDGDLHTLLNVYNAYNKNEKDQMWCSENFVDPMALESADNVRKQLAGIMDQCNLQLSNIPDKITETIFPGGNIKQAILAGYFTQVAHQNYSGVYRTLHDNQVVYLNERSCLSIPQWVIYHDCSMAKRKMISTLTEISGKWLLDYYNLPNMPNCDAKKALEFYEMLQNCVGSK